MKRKFALFNLALMAIVQFAIAYQSFHAFTHTHISESHTTVTNKHKANVASVNKADNCSVCDFHFDCFTAPPQFCLRLYFPFKAIPFLSGTTLTATGFTGSLFALRAPPALT
ncbi:hypothetical protein ACLI09_14125 [Flavobacterium sp. RHBU_24]|uniref:hypothetical protein n=1 Tax=Flavobacterium sp. RHBU_24 TaxID=3391185 RepID=UPI0039855A56